MPEVATGEIGETATLETDEEWGDDGELNLLTAPSGETNGDTKEGDTRKESASGGTYKAAPQEADAKEDPMSSLSERPLSLPCSTSMSSGNTGKTHCQLAEQRHPVLAPNSVPRRGAEIF